MPNMTREDVTKLTQELFGLASAEHQARASEIITELSEGFDGVLTDSENAATRISELTANNETLRAVNAKLFLKVGHADTGANGDPKPPEEDKPENTLTYEQLFNEKGELI